MPALKLSSGVDWASVETPNQLCRLLIGLLEGWNCLPALGICCPGVTLRVPIVKPSALVSSLHRATAGPMYLVSGISNVPFRSTE